MKAQEQRLDALANNLANVNTPGYHRDVPGTRSFHWMLSEATAPAQPVPTPATAGTATATAATPLLPMEQLPVPMVQTDRAEGQVSKTGRDLDLALSGDAFFVVAGKSGFRFTQAGNFTVSPDGYLATTSGELVQGDAGPIQMKGTQFQVSEDGVVAVDGKRVDKLRLVALAPGSATKVGSAQFASTTPQAAPASAKVKQGFLQLSNVNAIQEMATLMTATRAYETGQKLLQVQDQTLDRAVNEVGRV
jgi:flagellar basal-body rod protein FlgG